MPDIHPTAIIHPSAEIAEGVKIGPYSQIGPNIKIGCNSVIESHVVIHSHTILGEKCRIFPFASIGAIPQDLKFKGEESWVKIGNECIIREFVTIHRGTASGTGITEIGEGSFLMAYAHVAHDCKIGNHVIVANVATLAGHVEIEDYAIIGGITAIHQFLKIGAYAILGGMSATVKDIPPYVIASGNRAKLYGLNLVGLRRHNFSQNVISALKRAYGILIRSKKPLRVAIEEIKNESIFRLPEVAHFVEFIENSKMGIPRRWKR
jgi:UDP-N-acetylglucosamine acyltransferase